MQRRRRVCVIGAGVIGLSTAVRVQETNPSAQVIIVADKFSPHTTGDGSAGFWEPHLLNEGQANLVKKWGKETFDYLLDLLGSSLAGKLGVQLLSGYKFSEYEEFPEWRHQVYGFRPVTEEELKLCPGSRHGSFFTSISIDVKSYLPWLMEKFKDNGGRVEQRKIRSLEQLLPQYDVIVNCTGLGSRDLLGDQELKPIRGQVRKVKAPWLKHFLIKPDPTEEHNEIYIIPGKDHVTLGGTGQADNWSVDVDARDRKRIWNGCLSIAPSLKDAEIIKDWVGLRPQRSSIRLEMEQRTYKGRKKMIIHNYGHSGSGVTLHWGCAKEATNLVQNAIELLNMNSKM